MFALEGDLRKATETAEAKARSLQESQRALAAVVAKLGRNFNPFFCIPWYFKRIFTITILIFTVTFYN